MFEVMSEHADTRIAVENLLNPGPALIHRPRVAPAGLGTAAESPPPIAGDHQLVPDPPDLTAPQRSDLGVGEPCGYQGQDQRVSASEHPMRPAADRQLAYPF